MLWTKGKPQNNHDVYYLISAKDEYGINKFYCLRYESTEDMWYDAFNDRCTGSLDNLGTDIYWSPIIDPNTKIPPEYLRSTK